jgi:predicted Zn-dependent protease
MLGPDIALADEGDDQYATTNMALEDFLRFDDGSYLIAVRDMDSLMTSVMLVPAHTPGKDKLEDMIASIDDGYYLINSGNGQADTTGEFMFGVTMGYEIKGGKLGKALLDTTISGVAFEMLKTVDMVSDTMEWSSSGFCGKKQPMPVGMGGPALRCKVKIGGR